MNNGILAPQPFSVTTDLVGIKPLLGNPQPVPSTYARTIDSILGNSDGFSGKDFVMVIDTTKGGSTTISLNLGLSITTGPLEIFWGDGTSGGLIPAGTTQIRRPGSFETRFEPTSTAISLFSVSHTYPRHGIYIVVIKGIMGYTVTNVPHAGLATVAILSYGDLVTITTIVNHSACGASLLYVPPYIKPTDPAAGAPFRRNLNDCFNGCSNLNTSNFTTWDVSNVIEMRRCFQNCNITVNGNWNWDTRLVITFQNTFTNTRLSNITFSGWACNGGGTMFLSSNIRDCSFINWSGDNTLNMFQNATLNDCTLSGWRLTSAANAMFNAVTTQPASVNNLFVPNWDLRGVTNLSHMFYGVNGTKSGLDNWNVSGVTNMNQMFQFGSDFMTADLSNWDISKVTNFTFFMLRALSTNPSGAIRIDNWNIPTGCVCNGMFADLGSNKYVSLSGWNFQGNNSCNTMFGAANYTFPSFDNIPGLASWQTSGITSMVRMFYNTYLDPDVENWDVSNVTNMQEMFFVGRGFNKNLGSWNTSKVTNMNSMFRSTNNFNRTQGFAGSGLENWDVSSVTGMARMFDENYVMNRNLSGWNTGKVTSMANMFSAGSAGGNSFFTGSGINNWNVTGVTTVASMFQAFSNKTDLNVNLSGWNLCNCTDMTNFMLNCNIGSGNYDILLNSWEATSTGNPVKPWATGINVHFGTAKYTAASSGARQRLVNYGWTITDGGFQA